MFLLILFHFFREDIGSIVARKKYMSNTSFTSISEIERSIFIIRGQRVMLDSDLARLYGVSTMRLNEQVKRNDGRFPANFMFQLNYQEFTILISQIAISNHGPGGRRTLPYVFTEHGALMLANVLRSRTAVQTSIKIIEAFIHLRELAITHADLARKINAMEKKYDDQFKAVFDAIRQLMAPPEKKKRLIGFGRE